MQYILTQQELDELKNKDKAEMQKKLDDVLNKFGQDIQNGLEKYDMRVDVRHLHPELAMFIDIVRDALQKAKL